MKPRFFKTPAALRSWFEKNHESADELWIGYYKKGSGKTAVGYAEALDEALCFGWIDGIAKSVDEKSYMQRFTPRRPRSKWSRLNTKHVARLIRAGRMTPAGLAQVEAAKADGRWAAAYDSASRMTMPAEFTAALNRNRKARALFAKLNRTNLYAISYRLQSVKRQETRNRWIERIVKMLEAGETFHPQKDLKD